MIEALVGPISASFWARQIAPFFIRAQSRPRYMTPSQTAGYIDIFLPWFAFRGKEKSNGPQFLYPIYTCEISIIILARSYPILFPLELYYFLRSHCGKNSTARTRRIIIINNRTLLLFAPLREILRRRICIFFLHFFASLPVILPPPFSPCQEKKKKEREANRITLFGRNWPSRGRERVAGGRERWISPSTWINVQEVAADARKGWWNCVRNVSHPYRWVYSQ